MNSKRISKFISFQMEMHKMHAGMLDPTVGPRILRIAPLLDRQEGVAPDSKRMRMEYPSATRPRVKDTAQRSTKWSATVADGSPKGDGSLKTRLKVKNKRLAVGYPFRLPPRVRRWVGRAHFPQGLGVTQLHSSQVGERQQKDPSKEERGHRHVGLH